MLNNDFVISNGFLEKYTGNETNIVIPEEVTAISPWSFMSVYSPFTLTLSSAMECSFDELLSAGLTVLNISAGTRFKCTSCALDKTSSFLKLLKEINVDTENPYCASLNGILYSKDMSTLYACPASYEGDVVIPPTVTTIADSAFGCCKYIKEIILPESVVSIGNRVFADCTSLKKIVLPDNLTHIGSEVFLRCSKLISAGPKDSGEDFDLTFTWREEIPDSTFSGIPKLKRVVLPSTIKRIGKNAFKKCKALSDLTMPKDAKVEKNTFNGCDNLCEIKDIGNYVVSTTTTTEKKKKATKEQKPEFAIANEVLISYNGSDENVFIPKGVKTIGRRAFNNKPVVSVVLPEGAEVVEQEAFYWCMNLKSISLPKTIKKFACNSINGSILVEIASKHSLGIFTKSVLLDAISELAYNFNGIDSTTEMYIKNLAVIGANIKLTKSNDISVLYYLKRYADLRHAILENKQMSLENTEWFLEQLNQEKDKEIFIELLDYKNTLLKEPVIQKKKAATEKKEQEKALSTEITPAEWKKMFKFSYENGDVVIKETKVREDELIIPAYIGNKKVRKLDRNSLTFPCWHGLEAKSPKKIIISEGVEEICSDAISVVNGSEIFIPSTVTSLPENAVVGCKNIVLHLPVTLTNFTKKSFFYSDIKAIYAPNGSCAEKFAKENEIEFIPEQ